MLKESKKLLKVIVTCFTIILLSSQSLLVNAEAANFQRLVDERTISEEDMKVNSLYIYDSGGRQIRYNTRYVVYNEYYSDDPFRTLAHEYVNGLAHVKIRGSVYTPGVPIKIIPNNLDFNYTGPVMSTDWVGISMNNSSSQQDIYWTGNANNPYVTLTNLNQSMGFNIIPVAGQNKVRLTALDQHGNTHGVNYVSGNNDVRWLFMNRGVGDGYILTLASPHLPSAPTSLRTTSITSNSVQVDWNAPTNGVIVNGYNVFRRNEGDQSAQLIGTSATTNFTDNTVSPDTTYIYTVKAIGAFGESPQSNELYVTTEPSIPSAPTSLRATSVNRNSVQLAWNAPTNGVVVNSYNVFRRDEGDQPDELIGTSTTTNFKDNTVSPNTSYIYTVKAVGAFGESEKSNELSVTTHNVENPTIPQWELNVEYNIGDLVYYNDNVYRCIQAHTSHDISWSPANSIALWVRNEQ